MSRAGAVGTVYLLHFQPTRLAHAGHYLGWTEHLEARLASHEKGTGARLTAAARRAGISWVLARTWEGVTTQRERQLKKQGGRSRMCPVCWELRDKAATP